MKITSMTERTLQTRACADDLYWPLVEAIYQKRKDDKGFYRKLDLWQVRMFLLW